MRKRLSAISFQLSAFLRKHLSDGLILGGAGLAIWATWLLSVVAGMYVASACLIIFGVLVALGNGRQG